MAAKSESFSSGGQIVSRDVFLPPSAGSHPAVLMLHGTFGLMPEYRADIESFADALALNNIAAVMPHYLESTKTAPGFKVFEVLDADLPTWTTVCRDAFVLMA